MIEKGVHSARKRMLTKEVQGKSQDQKTRGWDYPVQDPIFVILHMPGCKSGLAKINLMIKD